MEMDNGPSVYRTKFHIACHSAEPIINNNNKLDGGFVQRSNFIHILAHTVGASNRNAIGSHVDILTDFASASNLFVLF